MYTFCHFWPPHSLPGTQYDIFVTINWPLQRNHLATPPHPWLSTYHRSTVQAKIFFCHILSLGAKWNMIFCLHGAFLVNSLSKQNYPSTHMLAVCMQGRERVFPFFLKLAAPCMILLRRFKILLGRWISGSKWMVPRFKNFSARKFEFSSWNKIKSKIVTKLFFIKILPHKIFTISIEKESSL